MTLMSFPAKATAVFLLFVAKAAGDIDECALFIDNCSLQAICTNTDGSFTCTCEERMVSVDDGVECTYPSGLSGAAKGVLLFIGLLVSLVAALLSVVYFSRHSKNTEDADVVEEVTKDPSKSLRQVLRNKNKARGGEESKSDH